MIADPAQLPLFTPRKPRGGKRRGAGRPPKGARAGSSHQPRPDHNPRHPVHVTLRAARDLGSLRRRRIYHAVRWATLTTARRESFRIVHLSVQSNHIHMLVEASDKNALSRGIQGFQISAAKLINGAVSHGRPGPRRRGAVFTDRYHAEVITSPRQAHHALRYVMANFRKHHEDRVSPMNEWRVDWFSSASMFPDWAEYGEEEWALWSGPPTYEPLVVFKPRTWLLAEGWKKFSPTISCWDVPSSR
jgi:REP element-mobilizing transposase RayT